MRKLFVVCAAVLCLSGAVLAQNDPTAPAASTQPMSVTLSGGQGRHRSMGGDDFPWQVGMNFLYQRYDLSGNNTGLMGFQTSVAKYLGDSVFGLEGAASASWGTISTGPTFNVKENVVFYGGGVRIAPRGRKLTPWVHGLFGGEHVRVTQQVGPASFNGFALMVGGGIDWKFSSRMAFRVQVDYLAPRINGVWQNTINVGGGIVVSF
jgi:opacity protein-like surface antigen